MAINHSMITIWNVQFLFCQKKIKYKKIIRKYYNFYITHTLTLKLSVGGRSIKYQKEFFKITSKREKLNFNK